MKEERQATRKAKAKQAEAERRQAQRAGLSNRGAKAVLGPARSGSKSGREDRAEAPRLTRAQRQRRLAHNPRELPTLYTDEGEDAVPMLNIPPEFMEAAHKGETGEFWTDPNYKCPPARLPPPCAARCAQ